MELDTSKITNMSAVEFTPLPSKPWGKGGTGAVPRGAPWALCGSSTPLSRRALRAHIHTRGGEQCINMERGVHLSWGHQGCSLLGWEQPGPTVSCRHLPAYCCAGQCYHCIYECHHTSPLSAACLQHRSCEVCVSSTLTFNCSWCHVLQRYCDGSLLPLLLLEMFP